MTRKEFERRYFAMPQTTRAELIEGIVYIMPSPVRYEAHGKPQAILAAWVGYYVAKTQGLSGFGDNATVRLDNDNEPQPDLFLMLPASVGGIAKVDADDYISGAPALVCEVSGSSTSIDLHAKKNAYRRNGVQEYLVWRTEDGSIDWFESIGGDFVLIAPDAEGNLRSRAFPGLWLNTANMLAANLPAIFALLDRSTSLPEHTDFVNRLRST